MIEETAFGMKDGVVHWHVRELPWVLHGGCAGHDASMGEGKGRAGSAPARHAAGRDPFVMQGITGLQPQWSFGALCGAARTARLRRADRAGITRSLEVMHDTSSAGRDVSSVQRMRRSGRRVSPSVRRVERAGWPVMTPPRRWAPLVRR